MDANRKRRRRIYGVFANTYDHLPRSTEWSRQQVCLFFVIFNICVR